MAWESLLRDAVALHQQGKLPEAEALYRQVLQLKPDQPDALHLLGVIAYQCGHHATAVNLIRDALQKRPNDPDILNNLAQPLLALGRAEEALGLLQTAVRVRPTFAEVHNSLGIAWQKLQRPDNALLEYAAALRARPDFPEAYTNRGLALAEKGDLSGAIQAHREALARRPEFAAAHCNLGNALLRQGDLDAALAAFDAARALQPTLPEAMLGQAQALHERQEFDAAVGVLRELVGLNPRNADAHNDLGRALKELGRMTDSIASFRRAVELRPDNATFHSNLLFALHYHPDYSAADLAKEHRAWARQHEAPRRTKPPAYRVRNFDPERRLRIGYVSPDFCLHPVARFLPSLLQYRDRERLEVYAYANVRRPDALTQTLRSQCDAWRDIVGLSDDAATELIAQDGIDVLVDLALHSGHNRLLIFARKPAPVQASYLAYCSTTGMESIDYRISDPYLDDPEIPLDIYSERTLRLPQSYWCYSIPDQLARPPVPLSPPTGPVTFGCLNNFCKISEPTLDCWSRILLAVPDSRLVLHACPGSHRARVVEHFVRRGVAADRIAWFGRQTFGIYMQTQAAIDVALDPFPFGGGTTTCDALWAGTPVVTLAGRTPVGRGGVSILSNLGLPELIAENIDDYVTLATRLAEDPERRRELRQTLPRRIEASPLMNPVAHAKALEAAFRQMWRERCAQGPRDRPA